MLPITKRIQGTEEPCSLSLGLFLLLAQLVVSELALLLFQLALHAVHHAGHLTPIRG
jgi:hypothetical protein